MGAGRGVPERSRSGRRRRRRLAAGLAVVAVAALATSCENDTDVLLRCNALRMQTMPLKSEATPDQAYGGGMVTLRIQPQLVTGVPSQDSAKVVSYDLLVPLPPEVEYAQASVGTGGTMLGRAAVEGDQVRIRYAGGNGTLPGVSFPPAEIRAVLRPTTNSTELVWRAPSRVDVMVEWNGNLGMDTCVPDDPSFRINSVGITPRPPDTWPGTWPGTFPGTFPGTRPAPVPGSVVVRPEPVTSTIVLAPPTSIVREDPPTTTTTIPVTTVPTTTGPTPTAPTTTEPPTTHPPHDH